MSLIPHQIGKYRVDRSLGEGGMGSVYLAHDTSIGRDVAIKLLRIDDDEMRLRFRGEAQAAGRLKHPNIVTVYDYSDFEGRPCIVMEYVQGDTIATLIKRGDPIPVVRKLRLAEQVCRGLAYAHRAGIVHRDIKPSNIMVELDDTIKIVDFGIARGSTQGLTRTGRMVGTLAYMSPEQVRGEAVDHRTDIFAMGLVLYEFLSGRYAFPGDSDFTVFNRIASGAPEPFAHPDTQVCELATPVINQALASRPVDRYQDASQLGMAVADVRRRLEVSGAQESAAVIPPPAPRRETPRERLVVGTPRSIQIVGGEADVTTGTDSATVKIGANLQRPSSQRRSTVEVKRPSSYWILPGVAIAGLAALLVVRNPGPAPEVEAPARSNQPSQEAPPRVEPNAAEAPPPATPPPAADPGSTSQPAPVNSLAPQPGPAAPPTRRETTSNQVTDPRLTDASRLFDEGDYARAAGIYESVLKQTPANAAARDGLAAVRRAQTAEQRVLQSSQAFRVSLTAAQRKEAELHVAEGRRQQAEGEYDVAIAAYEAALKIDPDNPAATRGIGETRKMQAAEAAVLKGRLKKPGRSSV